jgi:hypothetical protein
MVNIDPTLGGGGAARSYTRSAVAAAEKLAEEERLAEEARLAAEKLAEEERLAEEAAAAGGTQQTTELKTSDNTASSEEELRAAGEPSPTEGKQWIPATSTVDGVTTYFWEERETATSKGTNGSDNAFKQWTISQQQATQAAAEAGLESAQQILAGLVADFGLDPRLAETLNAELVRGESPTALAMRIRTTDEYKARFPGMAQRRELGLPAISETDYLDIERQYRSVMQAAKLPSTFHDEPADFDQWITGDVSPQEFQERVTLAETARDSADAETRRLLSDFYDISDGDLTAYYLDPTRAETIFEDRRRLESAGLAAASRQTVGQALEMETAEALQAESVQRREIQQRLGQRAGLTGELLGSEAMTASEIAEGEFGLDAEAIATLRRRREGRVAGFRGTAGALTTGAGITGFGAAE